MEGKRRLVTAFLILLSSLALVAHSLTDEDRRRCVFSVYIRTGFTKGGSTDSKISMELWNAKGEGVNITDLATWGGLMGQGYKYYQRGKLDIFSGRVPCINSGPVCGIRLRSDGKGERKSWYCKTVEVTTTAYKGDCYSQEFQVEQWLSAVASPYDLTATVSQCKQSTLTTTTTSASASASHVSS